MERKQQEYTYGLKGITLIEKFLDSNIATPVEGNTLEYNVSSNPFLDSKQRLLFQSVKVEIKIKGTDAIKGVVAIACAFTITGEIDIFSEENVNNEINSGVEMKTRLEALSTLRGVIFSEFRGTTLGVAMLPLISPSSMAKTSH